MVRRFETLILNSRDPEEKVGGFIPGAVPARSISVAGAWAEIVFEMLHQACIWSVFWLRTALARIWRDRKRVGNALRSKDWALIREQDVLGPETVLEMMHKASIWSTFELRAALARLWWPAPGLGS